MERLIKKISSNIIFTHALSQNTKILKNPILLSTKSKNHDWDIEKTIIKEITEHLEIPLIESKLTCYTAPGYRGRKLSDLLIDLLNASNGNLELAQKGVVLLTDIDVFYKIKNKSILIEHLLKSLSVLMHGYLCEITYKGKNIVFDTTNTTFISALDKSELVDDYVTANTSTLCGFEEFIDVDNLEINHLIEEQKKLNKNR